MSYGLWFPVMIVTGKKIDGDHDDDEDEDECVGGHQQQIPFRSRLFTVEIVFFFIQK